MDISTFRQDFPEFANTTDYPDAQVTFWLGVGGKLLRAERWFDLLDQGLELFTAHHLAIGAKDQATASAGGIPGAVQGNVSSKSVDKVSVSYDASRVTYDDAGFWNMTTYGLRYWNLLMLVGAGGVQL
jgi:hypothetical protein